jgi:hypothetical protein
MANKKFSEFTLKTNQANVDFLVGYDGTDNVRIDPTNIGGGATNLNELTDCLIDLDSLYVGEVPSGLAANIPHNTTLGIDSGTALTSGNSNTLIGNDAGAGITTGSGFTVIGKSAGNGATYTGSNVMLLGVGAEASSAGVVNEITLGNTSITSFRIPGLQSGASDGDVLTFNSSAGKLELQASGGGGASDLNGLSDCEVYTKSGNGSSYFIGTAPATGSTTVGYGFTAVGSEAGAATDMSNSFNYLSSFFGWRAGKSSTTPYQGGITAIGAQAGENNSTGSQWTNIGAGAGQIQNQNGGVAIGYNACWAATNASGVAIGRYASIVGSSSSSISIGENSNRNNTATGTVSIGYQAGYSNTSGANNINLGYQAGYSNTTAADRTIIGYEAGEFSTGAANTFLGLAAGKGTSGSSTGSYNTAIGKGAAEAITSGSENVVVGFGAMDANTDGNHNVAVGYGALGSETSGDRNTAIGYEALRSQNQTFSAHNTALGFQADDATVTGYQRTSLGAITGRAGTGSNITNIGYSAMESSNSASNEVTLGNSSVATLRCAVTSITSLSDERDKTEIKNLGYGLAFIDALQPREFVWDNRAETNKDGEEFYSSNKGKKDFGFIAQEVKELDNDTLRLVYDENPDKLELSYGKLVPILVQAIKELKEEVELLKS